MIRGAVFDVDGVIARTIEIHYANWARLFREIGRPFTKEDYWRGASGVSRVEALRNLLGESVPEGTIQELAGRKQAYFLESLEKEGIRPVEGVTGLISGLGEHGIRLAVASSSRNARVVLERLGMADLFEVIVDGEGRRSKPDPGIYNEAVRRLGLPASECVAFEDAQNGVLAAKAAGMRCVAITTTEPAERLREADRVITSFIGFSPEEVLSL